MTSIGKSALFLATTALVAATGAQATRPADMLPPPTWEIVGGDDDASEFENASCLEWSDVRFPGADERRPESEADDPEVLVDENDVPILDARGNFIGCEASAAGNWLSGSTPYLIGAFVLSQIILFAGGSGGNGAPTGPGGPTDSPG